MKVIILLLIISIVVAAILLVTLLFNIPKGEFGDMYDSLDKDLQETI